MQFKISAIPFVGTSFVYAYFSGDGYQFALASLIIFVMLLITKQVKLI